MFSGVAILDPGIRVIAGRYGIADMEVHRDECGWTFRCGTRSRRIQEDRAWLLMQRDDYGAITELVRDACRAISMDAILAKRRRDFRTKQRSLLARNL